MSDAFGPILVVDDDAAFRAMVAALLGLGGYTTVEAATGDEALALAQETLPALVLLDVEVPGLSGYEVCRQLREQHGQELPIIFLSGARTDTLDRVSGLSIGADDYVVKPFEPDELLARVGRNIARNQRSVRPQDDGIARLTGRERQILGLLASGRDQAAIALELVISPKTVATHIQRTLGKLDVNSRAQAVAIAHRGGLVERMPPAPAV